MHQLRLRDALGACASAALALVFSTCGTPTSPKPIVELAIQSISPSTGPATGGTEVTIRGAGFAAGSSVTIGGRAATDVTVRGSDMITAKTPASTIAGAVDIAVLVNGRTGTLAGGFRYEVSTNTPPVIKSLVVQGTRTGEPANFADYGETVRVTAVVEDAQTAPAALKYEWHAACGGSFTGTGAQVNWTAPISLGLPQSCVIELIVGDGPRIATTTVTVRLHNSALEVGNLAREFLTEFADNTISAELTVRNFHNACPGKTAEFNDVADVRKDYTVNSYVYGAATVTVAFGSMCKSKSADACVLTPVEWRSTQKSTMQQVNPKGISIISGVYRDARWWLCDSLFDPSTTLGFWPLH